MPELSLVGLSEDGRSLVLSAGTDETYSIRVDERLRAAVVSDRVRLGQLELELGAALRPKDIQSRIRSGERLEDVAAAAGVPPERIMTYAAPVLSERAHMATQARRSVLRRSEASGPRALAEAVTDRLLQRGVSAAAVTWDAWRRDDGKWTVSAAYRSGGDDKTALFVFDPLARVVVAGDDEARWLAGEGRLHVPEPRTSARPPDDARGRLTVVGSPPGELFDQDADATSADDERVAAEDAGQEADEFEDRNPTVSLAPVPADMVDPAALTFDETRPEPIPGGDTGSRLLPPADLAADEVADLDDETYASTPNEPARATPREKAAASRASGRAEPVSSPDRPAATQSAEGEDGQPEESQPGGSQPDESQPDESQPEDTAPSRKKAARKRATVPSWDDILFGTKSE
jgi:hypothetical protein